MSVRSPKDKLAQDVAHVAEKIGKPPTWAEYRRYGSYPLRAVKDMYGSMGAALSAGEPE